MNSKDTSAGKADPSLPPYTGTVGTFFTVVSLGMLFAGSIIAYVVTRSRQGGWPPPDAPDLPLGLWLSTAVMVVLSLVIHAAMRAARQNDQPVVKASVVAWALLAVVFLVVQIINWVNLIQLGLTPKSGFYGLMFFLLTALHAVHVVGGLIPLAFVFRHAMAGRYTPHESDGLRNCAIYWHFLDGVWIVMFLVVFVFN